MAESINSICTYTHNVHINVHTYAFMYVHMYIYFPLQGFRLFQSRVACNGFSFVIMWVTLQDK